VRGLHLAISRVHVVSRRTEKNPGPTGAALSDVTARVWIIGNPQGVPKFIFCDI
jgi:hypothetical protein